MNYEATFRQNFLCKKNTLFNSLKNVRAKNEMCNLGTLANKTQPKEMV